MARHVVERAPAAHLDFDEDERLIGIEVLAADPKLPQYLPAVAERLDAEGA